MVLQVVRLWSIPIASDGQITFCQLKIQTPKARVDESVAMESPFESPPKKNGRPSRLNGWFYIGKWYSSQPSSDGHPNSSWRWTKYQDAEACINKVPLLAIGCVRNERLACYDHFWVGGENDVLNTRDFMVLNTRRKFGSQTSDNMDR